MTDEVDGGPIGRVEGGGGCRIKWRVVLVEDKNEKNKNTPTTNILLAAAATVCVRGGLQLLAVTGVKDLLGSCEVCASRSQPICKTSETINPPPPRPPPRVGHSPGVRSMSGQVASCSTNPTRLSRTQAHAKDFWATTNTSEGNLYFRL